MAAGSISKMREAEKALKASEWASSCECVRTEYPARDLSILDLLPPGVSKGWALERLAARPGCFPQGDDGYRRQLERCGMLEWAGQGIVMGNAAQDLRYIGEDARLEAGRHPMTKTVWRWFLKQRLNDQAR